MALIMFDVSGSMTREKYGLGLEKLSQIASAGDRIIPFDHQTYLPMSYDSFINAPRNGGGGTSHRIAIQAVKDYRKDNEAVHFITDGIDPDALAYQASGEYHFHII